MAHRRLSRKELHTLVWTRPMRDLAAEFGISDVGLKKLCLRNDVQPPAQGHWQKVARGDAIAVPPLAPDGTESMIDIYGADPALTPKLPPEEQTRLEMLLERETLSDYRIVVPTEIVRLHPMTKRIKQILKSCKPDDYGCVRCYEVDLPFVRVAPQSIARALTLLDALIRSVERRGFRWQTGSGGASWAESAQLEIEGIAHPIGLHETTQRRVHRLTDKEKLRDSFYAPRYDFVSSGQFSIRPHNYRDYVKDTATKRLEVRLNDLMVILLNQAFGEREDKRRRAAAAATAAEWAAKRAEIAELKKVRASASDRLLAAAKDWKKAQTLRAFIAAIETPGTPDPSVPDAQWINWAKAEADALDPMKGDLKDALGVDFEALARLDHLQRN